MNMATRNEWNTYRLDDGLNIWGAPSFLGIPEFAGGLDLGDAITDTLVLNGRIATGSIAGAALDIDATYAHAHLMSIQADVSDWTGVGGTFAGMHSRISTSVASTNVLYGHEHYVANGPAGGVGADISFLQGFIYNVMGKGGSTIGMMRGGEIKCEWAADDTVTDAVGLIIEFMGLANPTNSIYGLRFRADSGVGSLYPFFQEIRMKHDNVIMSSNASPNGVITAPAGSLCLVSTGNSVATCAFINTDGGTTWTAFS